MTKTKQKAPSANTYEIEVDGRTLYLPRVTHIISEVMSQAKSGMAYWGAQLATQYFCTLFDAVTDDDDEDEWWEDFKASPMSPAAQLKEAQDRGTQAHDLAERLFKGEVHVESRDGVLWVVESDFEFVPTRYDLAAVRAYQKFADIDDMRSEERVYSAEYEFAGTADMIAGSVIGDFKTHKPPVRFSDMVQESAYGLAWEEMTGQHIDTHMVVLLGEDGDFTVGTGYVDPSVFLAVKEVWHALKEWRLE